MHGKCDYDLIDNILTDW